MNEIDNDKIRKFINQFIVKELNRYYIFYTKERDSIISEGMDDITKTIKDELYAVNYIIPRVNITVNNGYGKSDVITGAFGKYNQIRLVNPFKVSKDTKMMDIVVTDEFENVKSTTKVFTGPTEINKHIENDLIVLSLHDSANAIPNAAGMTPAEEYGDQLKAQGVWVGERKVATETEPAGSKMIFFSNKTDANANYRELVNNEDFEVDGFYRFLNSSPGAVKHGTLFFSRMNCSDEDILAVCEGEYRESYHRESLRYSIELDRLAGGAYRHNLAKLQARLENATTDAEKVIAGAEINKIHSRICLTTCTPMIPLGHLSRIFFLDGEVEYPQEALNAEEQAKFDAVGIEIGTNSTEGAPRMLVSAIQRNINDAFAEKLGYEISLDQARRLPLQMRANVVTKKGFETLLHEKGMRLLTTAWVNQFSAYNVEVKDADGNTKIETKDLVHIFYDGVTYRGQEIKAMLNGSDEEVAKANEILSTIELAGTKDEFKQINWDAFADVQCPKEIDYRNTPIEELENYNPHAGYKKVDLFLVNLPKASESGSSVQTFNKVATSYPQESKELVQALALMEFKKLSQPKDFVTLNKDLVIAQQPAEAINVLAKRSKNLEVCRDAAISYQSYRTAANAITSIIGKLKLTPNNSSFLTFVPNNLELTQKQAVNEIGEKLKDKLGNDIFTYVDILSSKVVNRIASKDFNDYRYNSVKLNEKIETVQCVEVYSSKVEREIRRTMKKLENSRANYTKEELRLIEDSIISGIALKYPSQGTREFQCIYFISKKEIEKRVREAIADGRLTGEQGESVGDHILNGGDSVLVLPADNSLKNALAGLDFDGGAGKAELPVVSDDCFVLDENGNKMIDENGQYVLDTVFGLFNPMTDRFVYDYASLIYKVHKDQENIHQCCVIDYGKASKQSAEMTKELAMIFEGRQLEEELRLYGKLTSNEEQELNNAKAIENKYFGCRFTATYSDLQKNGLPVIGKRVLDPMGLYGATMQIGDLIAKTVKGVSIPILIKLSTVFDGVDEFLGRKVVQNGKVNFDVVEMTFVPLQKAVDAHRANRKTAKYTSIFREGENRVTVTNRLGVIRTYTKVTNEVLDELFGKIAMLSEDMTVEEWYTLQADLDFVARALGESSIDVKKDLSKSFKYDIRDLISDKVNNLGNIKSSKIKTIDKGLYQNTQDAFLKEFLISFSDYCCNADEEALRIARDQVFDKYKIVEESDIDVLAETNPKKFARFMKDISLFSSIDAEDLARINGKEVEKAKMWFNVKTGKITFLDYIGELKREVKALAETKVVAENNRAIKYTGYLKSLYNLALESDYSFYGKYQGIVTHAVKYFPATVRSIETVIKYITNSTNPYSAVKCAKLDAAVKTMALKGIYNTAKLEGCPAEDVVRIATGLAFYNYNAIGKRVFSVTNKAYYSKLNTVMNFFGDIFIQDRVATVENCGYVHIELEVDTYNQLEDIILVEPDEILNFVDGVETTKGLVLTVPFTGQAEVKIGKISGKVKILAYYNPLQELLDSNIGEFVVLPIRAFGFSGEEGTVMRYAKTGVLDDAFAGDDYGLDGREIVQSDREYKVIKPIKFYNEYRRRNDFTYAIYTGEDDDVMYPVAITGLKYVDEAYMDMINGVEAFNCEVVGYNNVEVLRKRKEAVAKIPVSLDMENEVDEIEDESVYGSYFVIAQLDVESL